MRLRISLSIAVIAILCTVFLMPNVACAQKKPAKKVKKTADVQFEKWLDEKHMHVFMADGTEGVLTVDDGAKVQLTGTADLEFLNVVRAPLFVKLKTEISTRTKASTGMVDELEIVSASEDVKQGVLTDETPTFGAEPKKGPPPITQNAEITGVPTTFKNGVLVIRDCKIQIDPAAKITVKGDSIAALVALKKGMKFSATVSITPDSPDPPILVAAKIALSEPLTDPRKAKMSKKVPSTKSEKVKDDKKEEPAKEEKKEVSAKEEAKGK